MADIKAILFDLDDTLWPILPVIERAEQVLYDWLKQRAPGVAQAISIESMRARRKALMAQDPVYQLDLRRLRRAGLVEAFLQQGADPSLVDEAMDVFSRARNAVTPYPDVLPALPVLQQRYLLGSLSNGVADLKEIGLASYFRASLAAHELGRAKPDPEVFLSACAALGSPPSETVYVGDDPVLDVEGAQRAGLRGVWIDRKQAGRQSLSGDLKPDHVCVDFTELIAWLERCRACR